MICKHCHEEFEETKIEQGKEWEPIKGIKYSSTSYTHSSVCPFCHHNNSPLVILQ